METGLNGHSDEKILVYLGPSLSLVKAMEFLPLATYRPPAKQGDIVSDLVNYSPSRIFLIDGEFRQNLSVWHKELVYALQFPGVKAVYGASSMGALRAAELDYLGMIGVGRIYEWYRDHVTEDDSEVAVHYTVNKDRYFVHTVPLADIRAGCYQLQEQWGDQPIVEKAFEFFDEMRQLYYAERTRDICEIAWGGPDFPNVPQKANDACELLANYEEYGPSEKTADPEPEHLSMFFQSLYERDRRIRVNGFEVPQQNIDAHVILHNPEYERICWDASNQELALLLCNCLGVMVSIEEINRESNRFQQRSGITTPEAFAAFLSANGWSRYEYDRLMIQNSRIRKLQHALTVSKQYRRNTQSIIDYLRTYQDFAYWAQQAIDLEKKIQQNGVDDWLSVNLTPVAILLGDHFEREGLELNSNIEEYLLETGFSNLTELGVALSRVNAGKEQDG